MFRPKAELLMILLRQVSNKIHISHPTCDACKNYSTKNKENERICAEITVIWEGGKRLGLYTLCILDCTLGQILRTAIARQALS